MAAPEHWARLGELFDTLVELDPGARARALDELSRSEPELAAHLRRMLAGDAVGEGLLDRELEAVIPQPAEPPPPDRSGQRVGSYRLLERIGRGGMGEVYRAEREGGEYSQRVAVKLLRRGLDSEDVLRRFVQERRILAQLEHPGIARLIDGGVSGDGQQWLAMELVEGVSLTDYARDAALDLRARVVMLIAVCEAVDYAHRRLIVHRDLKPSNVLVEADGAPRLLDFGIAKLLDQDDDEALTGTGVRVLSPAYAAPEQLAGEPVSTATDVYALGLILYELLTGALPAGRSGPMLKALRGVEESIVRPSVALRQGAVSTTVQARALEGDLDTIVLKALAREPERRYGSAAALADDLRRYLDGRPIAARPDTVSYRLGKFVRRHRGGVAVAVLALLGILAALGIALWQADMAQRAARRADAEATRARAEATRAEREAAKSDRIADFLASLLTAADPTRRESSEEQTVGEVVKLAAERVDAELSDDPALQAAVLSSLSATALNSGDAKTGADYARRAHELVRNTPGVDPTVFANALRVYGQVIVEEGDPKRGEEIYREGLAAIAPDLALQPPRRAALMAANFLYNGIGAVLIGLDRNDEAAEAFKECIRLSTALYGADALPTGVNLYNLSIVYWRTDQPKLAEPLIEQTLAIHRKKLAPGDLRMAVMLNMHAAILDDLGQEVRAIEVVKEALAIVEAIDTPQSRDFQVGMQDTLGDLLLMRGEFDQAEPVLERGLAIAAERGDRNGEGGLRRSMGFVRLYQERYGEAVVELQKALVAYDEGTGGEGLLPLTTADYVAYARGLNGETDAALAELERLREPITAIAGVESGQEMIRRYHVGEVAAQAERWDLAIEALRSSLQIAEKIAVYKDSSYASQSRIWLGIALLAKNPADAEARPLIERGIARLELRSMGFHPAVKFGRAALTSRLP